MNSNTLSKMLLNYYTIKEKRVSKNNFGRTCAGDDHESSLSIKDQSSVSKT